MTHHLPGRLGKADLAARRRPGEALGHHDRLPYNWSRLGGAGRGDDLARADARPRAHAEGQLRRTGPELCRGAKRTLRIILVRRRDTHDGLDCVVAQLDDAAAVTSVDLISEVVEALEQRAPGFGVQVSGVVGAGQQLLYPVYYCLVNGALALVILCRRADTRSPREGRQASGPRGA